MVGYSEDVNEKLLLAPPVVDPNDSTPSLMLQKAAWFAEFATYQWDPLKAQQFAAVGQAWAEAAEAAVFAAEASQFVLAA